MSTYTAQSLGLSSESTSLLTRFGFDASTFFELRAAMGRGAFKPDRNRLEGGVQAPIAGDLTPWPEDGSPEARACEEVGEHMLARGEVAVAILNGGMATRFGGVVKGIVEVAKGKSFLGYKLADVAAAPGPVATFLMNSFATDAATNAHLADRDHFGIAQSSLHIVHQKISVRLTPEGDIYRDSNGLPSFYAPGHGDLLWALAESEAFRAWRAGGGKVVCVSNVDNLGACLSPKVIGAHVRGGRQATVEVAPRSEGDKGGAPARVDGHLEVVEGFRFPPDFDIESIPVFNTNTFVLDSGAIRSDYDLTWFRADKEVDGAPVVQFERLLGQMTAFLDATYLRVPREGPEGRFLPVKTPGDLDAIRPYVEARWG